MVSEGIVEEEIGGSGPKEYLIKYSEAILRKLNPRHSSNGHLPSALSSRNDASRWQIMWISTNKH